MDTQQVTMSFPAYAVPDPNGDLLKTTISATVTGTVTSPQVYVFIVDSGAVLSAAGTSVTATGATSYRAVLAMDGNLPAGSYSGNFSLRVCGDSACAQPYAVNGGVVPYSITVTPELTFTAAVNGVPATVQKTTYLMLPGYYNVDGVKSGDQVEIQASQAVAGWTWKDGGAAASQVQQTGSTWGAVATYDLSQQNSVGALKVRAALPSNPAFGAFISLDVTP
jgi:hypothetical protein